MNGLLTRNLVELVTENTGQAFLWLAVTTGEHGEDESILLTTNSSVREALHIRSSVNE